MAYQRTINLHTKGAGHMHDLTGDVHTIVSASTVRIGFANIFNLGSTAAVTTIEYEPGLEKDLPQLLNRLIPASTEYGHEKRWNDGNGHSHLQASMLGPEVTIPIQNGRPLLGEWQQIVHLECDTQPRDRTVVVTVVGT